MMHSRHFTRDDGTVVEVDGNVTCEGYGHGWYYTDYKAWRLADADDVNAPLVDLTDAENDRLGEEVAADTSITHDYYDDDY